MIKQNEKAFENKIKKYLDTLPKEWHFKHWAGQYSKAGVPDIIGCINGRFIGIEVKASKGKPTMLQIRNIKQINDAGGYARIVYPEQFEELKDDLQKIIRGDTDEFI